MDLRLECSPLGEPCKRSLSFPRQRRGSFGQKVFRRIQRTGQAKVVDPDLAGLDTPVKSALTSLEVSE